MTEKENTVSMIIFQKDKSKYKYFGEASYNIDKEDYGSYDFRQDNSIVIIYSKNIDKYYTNLEIKYKNVNNDQETLTINDKIENSNFIKMFVLTNYYANTSIKLN